MRRLDKSRLNEVAYSLRKAAAVQVLIGLLVGLFLGVRTGIDGGVNILRIVRDAS